MRSTYNRQTIRAAQCIRARTPRRRRRIALSHRGLVLTVYGHDLARLADSIAGELELSDGALHRLLGTAGMSRY